MHPGAKAVRAFGKGRGVVELLDTPCEHMGELDETEHRLWLILVQRSGVPYRETGLPSSAGDHIGVFWDNRTSMGYHVFTRKKRNNG